MTGVLGPPVPAPTGQWQAALDHAVNAADDGALDELVPDLWAEPDLPPASPSEDFDGTTPDATVLDPLLPGLDDWRSTEIAELWTDPTGPEGLDDPGDWLGPDSW